MVDLEGDRWTKRGEGSGCVAKASKLVVTRLAITDQSEVAPGSSLLELGRSPCVLVAAQLTGVAAYMQQRRHSLQVRSPAAVAVHSTKRILSRWGSSGDYSHRTHSGATVSKMHDPSRNKAPLTTFTLDGCSRGSTIPTGENLVYIQPPELFTANWERGVNGNPKLQTEVVNDEWINEMRKTITLIPFATHKLYIFSRITRYTRRTCSHRSTTWVAQYIKVVRLRRGRKHKFCWAREV